MLSVLKHRILDTHQVQLCFLLIGRTVKTLSKPVPYKPACTGETDGNTAIGLFWKRRVRDTWESLANSSSENCKYCLLHLTSEKKCSWFDPVFFFRNCCPCYSSLLLSVLRFWKIYHFPFAVSQEVSEIMYPFVTEQN